MQVEMRIKDWKIEDREKSKEIVGKYELLLSGKCIADRAFNDGYSSGIKIPFSGDLMQKVKEVENMMIKELNGFLT